MTDDPLENPFRELNWRRKLTPAEETQFSAWIETHPEALADWESEVRLTDALSRLPSVPVPSNFTARVMQSIEGEVSSHAGTESRERRPGSWLLRWLPKSAFAAAITIAGLLSYHYSGQDPHVQSLRIIARVNSVPDADALENFDTIRAMGETTATAIRTGSPGPMPVPAADEELLALLQ